MTLFHIDSLSELSNLNRTYPDGRNWSGGAGVGTGRDGQAQGAAVWGANTGLHVLRSLPGISGTTVAGVACNLSSSINSFTHCIIAVLGDTNTAGVTHLSLTNNSAGKLELRRGPANGGTTLAAGTTTIPVSEWHYYEMKCTIADSGGTAIVRVDGVEVINFTGDTRNGGTFVGIDGVAIGAGSSGSFFWDDLYVCDTSGAAPANDFLGDISVKRLFPNGDGAVNQFVGSDGNSVQNYLLADENPANTTDWNASAVVGQRDLYALDDLPANAVTVFGMQAFVTSAKTDAGARSMKVCDRGSATVRAAATQPLSTTYVHYASPLYTTDGDGTALTPVVVNAVQVGAEVV